ncbi:DUF262 domain-containing protein [Flavobacterium sp.]|jgi:hypothetical protein|uniref:DUF262 domain-containing protein n=1 Tax=Flavobacterium sp. TaxID=239 RepID=UPI0037C099CB
MKLIEQIDIQPQSTKWLFDLHTKGLIEVDNSFQRNYVWLEKNQIKLIETILIGSPIPEIYLWNTGTNSETGDTKYSIVDGQQRTGAIFQFIQNKYKLKEASLDSEIDIFSEIKNRTFSNLDDKHKQAIWSYVFSIRIVRTPVEREKIVQMFLRLNSGNMTLNPQELRNAEFEGEFMLLASELSELAFWEDNKLFGLADRRRMRDITFVSNLLTFMKLGIDEEITSKNINRIYELFNEEYPNREKDKEIFIEITENINKIIDGNDHRKSFLNGKVHLYTLFNFIYSIIISGNSLTDNQIDKYRNFIDNYDLDLFLNQHFEKYISIINEYKSKSKEGTNQKSNRINRFEILKQILE